MKAYTDDMQVAMKMSDRAGVMSGLMFSMKHGLGKQFFVPPECKMQSETYWSMLENEYAPQLGVWYGSAQAVFIQDGAPSHTSKRTRVFMNDLWKNTAVLHMDQQCLQ